LTLRVIIEKRKEKRGNDDGTLVVMHGVEWKWFARSVDRHTDMATYLVPSMCLDLARYSTL